MSKIGLAIYHLTNGVTYKEKDLIPTWGSSSMQESYIVIGKKIRKLYSEVSYCERDGDIEEWNKHRYYLGIIEKEELEEYSLESQDEEKEITHEEISHEDYDLLKGWLDYE